MKNLSSGKIEEVFGLLKVLNLKEKTCLALVRCAPKEIQKNSRFSLCSQPLVSERTGGEKEFLVLALPTLVY